MANVNLPKDPELAKAIIEADSSQQHKHMERGWIGIFLGYGHEKSGNVAGIISLLLLALIALILFFGVDSDKFAKKDQVLMILPLLTSALGFMFGQKSN